MTTFAILCRPSAVKGSVARMTALRTYPCVFRRSENLKELLCCAKVLQVKQFKTHLRDGYTTCMFERDIFARARVCVCVSHKNVYS